jgi:hypothetical protein
MILLNNANQARKSHKGSQPGERTPLRDFWIVPFLTTDGQKMEKYG